MYDPTTWQREALRHCLWLVARAGPEYALQAADKAERESAGVLAGLKAKVQAAIDKHKAGERDARC